MATVVLPNTIADGNVASGSEVQQNFEALRDGINSVDNTQLATDAVQTAHITDGAVQAAKIAAGAVTNAKLAAASVTNDKIADATITPAKFDSSVVQMLHLVQQVTITASTTDTQVYAGFDSTKHPAVSIKIQSGGWWAQDATALNNVTVRSRFVSGGNFEVEVTNNTAGSIVIMESVIGQKA